MFCFTCGEKKIWSKNEEVSKYYDHDCSLMKSSRKQKCKKKLIQFSLRLSFQDPKNPQKHKN